MKRKLLTILFTVFLFISAFPTRVFALAPTGYAAQEIKIIANDWKLKVTIKSETQEETTFENVEYVIIHYYYASIASQNEKWTTFGVDNGDKSYTYELYIKGNNNGTNYTKKVNRDGIRGGFTISGVARTGYTYISNYNPSALPFNREKIEEVNFYTWEERKGTITYNGNGSTSGSTNATQMKYTGIARTAKNSFKRTGYTFQGWATSSKGNVVYKENVLYKDANVVPTNATLYAVWKENTATLTYNANNKGTAPDTVTMKYTQATSAAAAITDVVGYTFNEWNTQANGTGTPYAVGQQIKAANVNPSTTTLYAQWTPNTYNITYKDEGDVDFTGTLENDSPSTHTYDTETILKSAEKYGYEFGGWHKQADCSDEAITKLAATDYTDNITLYADWIHVHGDLTYSAQDNVLNVHCGKDPCPNPDFYLTLTKPSSLVYTGSPIFIDYAEGEASTWKEVTGSDAPIIEYYLENGTTKTNTSNSGAEGESKAPVNAGKYVAKATVDTDKTAELAFEIAPKEISISWDTTSFAYNGNNHRPTATTTNMVDGDTFNPSYIVSQGNVQFLSEYKNAGTYSVYADFRNDNYEITDGNNQKYTITKLPLTLQAITDQPYTGSQIKPTVTINGLYNSETLTLDTDYEVTYDTNINAGEATGKATVTLLNTTKANNYEFKNIDNVVTFNITTIDYTDVTKEALGNLNYTDISFVNITLPDIPDGASYRTPVKAVDEDPYTLGTITDGVIKVSSSGFTSPGPGDMTFKVPVKADNNHNDYDITVTITPFFHEHNFTYSASDNVIEAVCGTGEEYCDQEDNTIKLILVAPDASNLVYKGEPIEAYFKAEEKAIWEYALGNASVPEIKYYLEDGTTLTTPSNSRASSEGKAPINVGKYVAKATVNGETAELAFEITKAELTMSGATATKTYDKKRSATVTKGTLEGIKTIDSGKVSIVEDSVSGTFDNANARTDKAITLNEDFTITGEAVGNYYLTQPTVLGTITPKDFNGSGINNDQRVVCELGEFIEPTFHDNDLDNDIAGEFVYTYNEETKTKQQVVDILKVLPKSEQKTVTWVFTPNGNYAGTVTGSLNFTMAEAKFKVGEATADETNAITIKANPTYGDLWKDIVTIKSKDIIATLDDVPGTGTYSLNVTGGPDAGDGIAFEVLFTGTIDGVDIVNKKVLASTVNVAKANPEPPKVGEGYSYTNDFKLTVIEGYQVSAVSGNFDNPLTTGHQLIQDNTYYVRKLSTSNYNVSSETEFVATNTHNIVLEVSGSGKAEVTINDNPITSATRDEVIALTATPNPGYFFDKWEVVSGLATISDSDKSNTTITLTMPNTDIVLKAHFKPIVRKTTSDDTTLESKTTTKKQTNDKKNEINKDYLIKISGQAPSEEAAGYKDYYEYIDPITGEHRYFEDPEGNIEILDLEVWKTTRGSINKLDAKLDAIVDSIITSVDNAGGITTLIVVAVIISISIISILIYLFKIKKILT